MLHRPRQMWPTDHGPSNNRCDDYVVKAVSAKELGGTHPLRAAPRRTKEQVVGTPTPGDPGSSDPAHPHQPNAKVLTQQTSASASPAWNSACWSLLVSRSGDRSAAARSSKRSGLIPRSPVPPQKLGGHPVWWMSTFQAAAPNWEDDSRQPRADPHRPGARVYLFQRHRGIRW